MHLPANLLADAPEAEAAEVFADVLVRSGCRIERIVSRGQVTPTDRPYLQAHDEWVLVISGLARIAMNGAETTLAPGDHLLIPAGSEHRVTFTAPDEQTVWLAVHLGEQDHAAPD